ncbi:MAG: tRNA (adenosine(37)-N6)-threonylcarbamoyltransferase complex dimerization subunit type 1 TsaB [Spirochaetia bacterium]
MNILAVDTSSELLSITLQNGDGIYGTYRDVGLRHSEILPVLIGNLFEEAGISASDLDLTVYASGPGSFTGLRIGAATVKGIAAAKDVPFVGVPVLDMLSHGLNHLPYPVVPVIDAKKRQFYAAVYNKGQKAGPYLDISPEELDNQVTAKSPVFITGPHAELFKERYGGKLELIIDPLCRLPKSRNLITLGSSLYRERGGDSDTSSPIYLRLSEAELDKKAGKR